MAQRKWMSKKELPLTCKGRAIIAEADSVGVTFRRKRSSEKIVVDWLTVARLAFGQGYVFNTRERIERMGL